MKRTTMIVAALLAAVGAQAELVVTVDAAADAYISQHVNEGGVNYGASQGIYVARRDVRYQNPVEAPAYWGLIQWDLSGIDSQAVVSDVTFQIQCIEVGVGITDVYVIDSGAWTELGVTWNSWVPAATDTLLGSMTGVPSTTGLTTFNNAALTTVVQDWVDGDRTNLGLVFKWQGEPAAIGTVGDNFASREHAGSYIDPQLAITIPEPATLGMVAAMGGALLFIRKRFMI